MTKRTRVKPVKMWLRCSKRGDSRWARPEYTEENAAGETINCGWEPDDPIAEVMVLDYRDYLALKRAAKAKVKRGK